MAKWQTQLPQPRVLAPARATPTSSKAQLDPATSPDVGYAKELWPNTLFGKWQDVDDDQSEYHGVAPEFFDRTVDGTKDDVNLDGVPYYQLKKADGTFADTLWYSLDIKAGTTSLVTKVVKSSTGALTAVPVTTPFVGYGPGYVNGNASYESAATLPGPLFKTRVGQPVVVRNWNETDELFSTHLHGAHTPTHSDGYAAFVNEPGNYRDYYYPNTVPMGREDKNGNGTYEDDEYFPDFSESPSNLWYHDHGIDVTDKHVLRGAAAYWQTFDDDELELVKPQKDSNGVTQPAILPGWWSKEEFNEDTFMANSSPYDLPIVLKDMRFNADGSIYYDPENFDGTLGDVTVVNGSAYPVLNVEPTTYRFRILNGAVARFYNLKLSDSRTDIPDPSFISIGSDTWMYPKAIKRDTLYAGGARRADVGIDFSKYNEGDVVYLENILEQTDGRGPKGTADDPEPIAGDKILKFVVGKPNPNAPQKPQLRYDNPATPDIDEATKLREHIKIHPDEVTATRTFDFHRSNGHWIINQIEYRPEIAHITPTNGAVERWVLKNNSGGWSHPVHIHLESHQVEIENGHEPRPENAYKVDTSVLDPNGEMVVLVRFRTFGGPYMMHCHIGGHEDKMMMANIDVTIDPNKPDESIISVNHAPPLMDHWDPEAHLSSLATSDTVGIASLDPRGHSHGSNDRGPHSGLPWCQG